MKQLKLAGFWLTALLILAGCGGSAAEIEVAELPTMAATVPLPLPPTNIPPTLGPTNTAVPNPPTRTPIPTPAPPTETPVVSFAATDTPTPTRLPGILPTFTPTPLTPLNLGVGYQGDIGPAEFRLHVIDGRADQTVFGVVRVKPEVDPGLLIFEGDVAALAREQQISVQDYLISQKANREADFSGLGFMEVIAYTPKEDGPISILVTNSAPGGEDSPAHPYRLYVFDQATASANIVFNQTVSLDGGQTTTVGATSNGGKPVVAFINPLDTAVDPKIVFKNSGGASIVEANFAGRGSYETSFVLPLRTTSYSIELSNVGGGGLVEILVLAIQDPF